MIKVGLPKGVLKQKSYELADRLLNIKHTSGQLYFIGEEYHVFLLKHRDIPKMIDDGLLDIGITSTEWLEESGRAVRILKFLDWCNTRISLICPVDSDIRNLHTVRCVTEFPNIAQSYFNSLGQLCQVYYVSGSSEAFVSEIFDCCVDCVETGKTLIENNLKEDAVIFRSQVAVVAQKDIDPNHSKIADFISLLERETVV